MRMFENVWRLARRDAGAVLRLQAVVSIAAIAATAACSSSNPGNQQFVGADVIFGVDSGPTDVAVDTNKGGTDTGSSSGGTDGSSGDKDGGPTTFDAGPGCTASCQPEGSKKCSGLGFQVCEDLEDNGCFTWSKVNTCGKGTICSAGECVKKCPDEPCTTAGAKKCSAKGEIIECFDFDGNGCLEWGNAKPCPSGQVCSGGFCALGCKDECNVVGAKKCDGNKIAECGDSDKNGCLDWGKTLDCGAKVCSAGFCADKCKSECTTKGATKCDTGGVATCDDYNKDTCLEWGTPKQCAKGQVCSGGQCADSCKNECTAIGAKKCDAAGKITKCGDFNKDGCLEWGTGTACAKGLVCDSGFCANKCSNACTAVGAKKCDVAGKVTVCGDYNKDGCLEWGSGTPCGAGTMCSNGQCAQSCSNACNVKNGKQCVAGQKAKYQVCDDYNKDGCLEWGTAQGCGSGQVCSLGQCAATCQNACDAKNAKQCKDNATQVCGDYNNDGCLEWGTPKQCEAYELCVSGACKHKPNDKKVVINEVMYDSAGPDTDTFVELHGPAGTSLKGWSLVGVNGNKGINYKVVELSGVIGSDGFFVIAHTKAKDWISKEADLKHDNVDYENGPDSIELRFGAKKADAVGYGKFTSSHKFGGEGQPAPDAAGGQSIGRDAKQTDTGDNSKDFKIFNAPTPGSANSVGNKAPKANIICPQPGNPGQKLTFDASGSTDPDGSIKLYTFEWGDKTTPTNSPTAKVQHAYAKAGSYTVKLTVSDDKGEKDSSTCIATVVAVNKPPVAKISCPGQAGVNKTVTIDGSASSDPDGKIAVWSFNFGDGTNPTSGPQAKVTKAWNKAGQYKVTLTVTDDKNGKHSASCTVNVSDATPPQVSLIKPNADKQVTQGDKLPIIVDASVSAGKKVASVWVEADGKSLGTDTSAPYSFSYTVPANAKTGSAIQLVAKAKDTSGSVGSSKVIKLNVKNDKPVAKFTAVVSGKLKVVMDASASSDTETAKAALQVRWDFTGDGTWDTPWSKAKVYEHTYGKDGKYTIKVQVKDAVGQVSESTRTVTLSSIQYLSGTIKTTTWTGTVVITGDTTVPSGNTLTIGKGTQVLFTNIDQNKDKVGDYDLRISGKVIVNGTADDPVVFTVYGKSKVKNGWNRIVLQGQGSTIKYAIIEYAQTGIEVRDASTIQDTTLRFNGHGIQARSSAKPKLINNTVKDNTHDGLWINESAQVSVTGGHYSSNGKNGIGTYSQSTNASLNVTGARLESNKQNGLFVQGRMKGLVTKSHIHHNAYEGVRAQAYDTLDPTIAVRVNNISENSSVGARIVQSVTLTAKSSNKSSSNSSSSVWKTPGGEIIDMVRASYSESDYYKYNYIRGAVLGTGGKQMTSWSSTTSARWRPVDTYKSTTMQAYVYDKNYSYFGTTSIHGVAYTKKGVSKEISVITNGTKLDFRHNYLGTFPNVLSVVTLYPKNAANLDGFVGKSFGSTWNRAPYYGGETLTKDTTWNYEVWITGDLTVAAAKTLNITAGTKVNVVRYDQLGDGKGDFSVRVYGTLKAHGVTGKPVLFTENGNIKKASAWNLIQVSGNSKSKADLKHVIFEYARTGLQLGSGAHVLDNVTFRHNAGLGLEITSASNVKATKLTAVNNGEDGVFIYASKGVSIDGLKSEANKRHGLHGYHSYTVATIKNATIQKNAGDGVRVQEGVLNVSNANIKSNGAGVKYIQRGRGALSKSNILYNQHEGIVLQGHGGQSPSPVITGNNIFGNSVTAGGVFANANITAKSSNKSSSGATSPVWSTPKGEQVSAVRFQYSESDYYKYNYISGGVRGTSPKSVTLWSVSSNYSSRWMDVSQHKSTKIQCYVNDKNYSYWGQASVSQVFYRSPKVLKELAAITDSGTVNCKDNYWGVFPDVAKMLVLSRTNAVDYQGFVGAEKNGTGPN